MTVAQLEYAPAAPLRRRKLIRRGILLIVLIAVIAAGWRFGPDAFSRAKFLYYQRQCMGYQAPADQVVYDENSDTSAGRMNQPPYSPVGSAGLYAAGLIALPVKNIAPSLPPVSNVMNPGTPGSGATLFVHELRNRAGQRRLVLVQHQPFNGFGPIFQYPFGLDVFVFEPATWNTGPKFLNLSYGVDWDGPVTQPSTKGLRFYAGQIDANDAAHFTIRYELEGKTGLIDGRLNDAGNDLKIKILSGPAVSPSPWTTQVGR